MDSPEYNPPDTINPHLFDKLYAERVPRSFIQGMCDWADKLDSLEGLRNLSNMRDGSPLKASIGLVSMQGMAASGDGQTVAVYDAKTKSVLISKDTVPYAPNEAVHTAKRTLSTAEKLQALEITFTVNHEYRHHLSAAQTRAALDQYNRDIDDPKLKDEQILDAMGRYAHVVLDGELDARFADYKLLNEAVAKTQKQDPKLAAAIQTDLLDSDKLFREMQAFEKKQGHPISKHEFHDNFRSILLNDYGYARSIAGNLLGRDPSRPDPMLDRAEKGIIERAGKANPCPSPQLQSFKDQLDEQLKPKLLAAGCSEKVADAMIAVGVEKCAGIKGADSITFAGVDKEKNRIVVQTNVPHALVAFDAIAASKADPAQTLASAEQTLQQSQQQQVRQQQAPSHGGHSLS